MMKTNPPQRHRGAEIAQRKPAIESIPLIFKTPFGLSLSKPERAPALRHAQGERFKVHRHRIDKTGFSSAFPPCLCVSVVDFWSLRRTASKTRRCPRPGAIAGEEVMMETNPPQRHRGAEIAQRKPAIESIPLIFKTPFGLSLSKPERAPALRQAQGERSKVHPRRIDKTGSSSAFPLCLCVSVVDFGPHGITA